MKPIITFDEFAKNDFRVGHIIAASSPEWSEKLIELTVDFGPEIGQKTILSGIRKWYSSEQMVGKLYPFIINLAERKMGQGISQGMMLMVDASEQPLLIELSAGSQPGQALG
jgi:methionyl-tRNA synthetase